MEVEPYQAPYQPLAPKPIQWTPSKETSERMERMDSPHARAAGQDSLHGLGRQPRKGKQSFTPIKSNTPSRLQEEREQERLKEREKERDRLKDEIEMKDERDEHSLKRKEPPAWHRKRRSLYCLPIKQICHANRKQLYVDTIYDDVRDVVHISTLSTNPNQDRYAEAILEQLSYYRDLIETLKIFFLPSGREALLACAKDENVQMEIRQECSALINTWDSLKKFKPKPSSFKAPAQAATILDDDEPGTDSVSLKDKLRVLDEDEDSVEPALKKQKRDHVQSAESDDIVVEPPTVATSSQSTTASSSTSTATTTPSAIPVETQLVFRGSADVFKMPVATASIFREQQADKERADKEKVDKEKIVIDVEANKPVLAAEATPLTTPKKLQMVTDPTDTTFSRPPKKDDVLESKEDVTPSSTALRLSFEAPEKKADSEDKETTESASTGLSISFGTLPSGHVSLSLPALPTTTSPSKPSFSFGVGDTGLKIPSFGSLAGITTTETATVATSTASTATSTDSTATTTATASTATTPAPTGLFKDIFFGAPEKKDTHEKKEGGLATLGQSSPVFNFRASTTTTTSATTAGTTAPLGAISFGDKATTTATTSTNTTTAAFVFGATSPAKEAGTGLFPTAPTTTTTVPTAASTPAFSGFNVEAAKPGPSSSFSSLFDGVSSKPSKEKSKPSLSQTGSGPLAGFTFGSNNAAPTTTASTQAPTQSTSGSVFSFGATQQTATAPPTATPSVFPSFGSSSSSTSTSNMFGGGSGMNEESTSTFPKFGNNSDSMDMGSPSPFVPNSQSSGAIFTSFNSNAASSFGSAPSFGSSTASPFSQNNSSSAPVFPFGDANKPAALSTSHFGTTQNVFGSNTNNNSNSGSMFGQQQNKPLFANPSTASITPSMFNASPAPSNNNSGGGMFSSSSSTGGSSFQGFGSGGSSGEADMFGLGGAKNNAPGGRKKVVAKRNTKGK